MNRAAGLALGALVISSLTACGGGAQDQQPQQGYVAATPDPVPTSNTPARSKPARSKPARPTPARPNHDPTNQQPSSNPTATSEPGGDGHSPDPTPTPDTREPTESASAGIEVNEAPTAQPTLLPGLPTPASDPHQPLVSMPLPTSAHAEGRLVAGYPRRALPLAPDLRVIASSVASSGRQFHVTLSARTTANALELLVFYRSRLSLLGFTERPAPAIGGSTAVTFRRGRDTVTITLTPDQQLGIELFAALWAGA